MRHLHNYIDFILESKREPFSTKIDYYKTLGLDSTATMSDIKDAYDKLIISAKGIAKKHLGIAYRILSNQNLKDKYDSARSHRTYINPTKKGTNIEDIIFKIGNEKTTILKKIDSEKLIPYLDKRSPSEIIKIFIKIIFTSNLTDAFKKEFIVNLKKIKSPKEIREVIKNLYKGLSGDNYESFVKQMTAEDMEEEYPMAMSKKAYYKMFRNFGKILIDKGANERLTKMDLKRSKRFIKDIIEIIKFTKVEGKEVVFNVPFIEETKRQFLLNIETKEQLVGWVGHATVFASTTKSSKKSKPDELIPLVPLTRNEKSKFNLI